MFVFLVIAAMASIAVQAINTDPSCAVCELGGLFTEANGYLCFPTNNRRVACTCPDRHYTIDNRCRICDRANICGDDPDGMCAESSPSSFGSNSTYHFACFCSNGKFYLGEPCPSTTTTTLITTTPFVPSTTRVVTFLPNTAITSPVQASTGTNPTAQPTTQQMTSAVPSTATVLPTRPFAELFSF